jgi:hypothetical protein
MTSALVGTVDGTFAVDLESEEVLGLVAGPALTRVEPAAYGLPRVVASAASGSTAVVVVDRRPPLLISHDAGRTWREAGGGLPAGSAIAIAQDDPDLVLYAARNRLYLSGDGGRFWRALAPELPAIEAVALV